MAIEANDKESIIIINSLAMITIPVRELNPSSRVVRAVMEDQAGGSVPRICEAGDI